MSHIVKMRLEDTWNIWKRLNKGAFKVIEGIEVNRSLIFYFFN